MAIVKNIILISLFLVLLTALIPGCTRTTQQIQTSITEQTVFTISNLHTEPLAPQPDETFSFIVTVTNSGDKQAIYDAALDIIELVGKNEEKIDTILKNVTVASGDSEIISFGEMHLMQGTYRIVIDDIINIIKVSCT